MSTLYRPVVIETAEQAEALPIGSVLIRHRDDETTRVATRIHRGPSPDHVWRTGDGFHRHSGVVGMQALVPIEAEEERDDEWADYGGANRRRLVTPWEAS